MLMLGHKLIAVRWEIAGRTRCHNTLKGKTRVMHMKSIRFTKFSCVKRENSVRDSATPLKNVRNILRPLNAFPKLLKTLRRRRNINNHRIMNVKSSLTFDSMLIPFSLRVLGFPSLSNSFASRQKKQTQNKRFLDCNSIVVYSKFFDEPQRSFPSPYCFTRHSNMIFHWIRCEQLKKE